MGTIAVAVAAGVAIAADGICHGRASRRLAALPAFRSRRSHYPLVRPGLMMRPGAVSFRNFEPWRVASRISRRSPLGRVHPVAHLARRAPPPPPASTRARSRLHPLLVLLLHYHITVKKGRGEVAS